jgi:hypothetical protein
MVCFCSQFTHPPAQTGALRNNDLASAAKTERPPFLPDPLPAAGLLDEAGNVAAAGERWTLEQMERLRREVEERGRRP